LVICLERLEARRIFSPKVAAASQVIAQLEELVHVGRVKCRGGPGGEIRRDIGQVIVIIIPLGIDIEAEEVAHPLGFEQGVNGPGGDIF